MPLIRLQKILAAAGVAGRRASEDLIAAGRVAVDGQIVTALGTKADPRTQAITLDGRPLPQAQALQYWLVHKPAGYMSTTRDPQNRPKVGDLLPEETRETRLYPVGRLDYDSEGLLLMTNDGELTQRLLHPRFKVPKHYRVWVAGLPAAEAIQRLREGIMLEGHKTAPAQVHLKQADPYRSRLNIAIYEGRKREIRLMCREVGHPVQRLIRVSMGPLHLLDLPAGASRPLTSGEIHALKTAVGLISSCKLPADSVKTPKRAGAGVSRKIDSAAASRKTDSVSGSRKTDSVAGGSFKKAANKVKSQVKRPRRGPGKNSGR